MQDSLSNQKVVASEAADSSYAGQRYDAFLVTCVHYVDMLLTALVSRNVVNSPSLSASFC
jgi:hypothetical protein